MAKRHPDPPWKKFERRVAAFFGSVRRSLSGGNSKGGRDDSMHPTLFIEAKHRAYTPIYTLYDETALMAAKEKRIPVIALHEKGRKGFLLVVHCDDLEFVAACVS